LLALFVKRFLRHGKSSSLGFSNRFKLSAVSSQ
jgi:hypothetical protein